MNRKQRIESIIKNNFEDCTTIVTDNSKEHSGHNNFDGTQESHFKISFKNENFLQDKRLDTHRKINELLKDEFKSGLHALEIIIK